MKTLVMILSVVIALFFSQGAVAQTEISIDTEGDKMMIYLKQGKKDFHGEYDTWKEMEEDEKLKDFLKKEMKMDIFNVDRRVSKLRLKEGKRKNERKHKKEKCRKKEDNIHLSIDLNL